MKNKQIRFLISLAFAFWLYAPMIQSEPMPRGEHPRPDLMRANWQCLNGEWEFQFDPENRGEKENWPERKNLSGKIIVPFEIESGLSGIKEKIPADYFWYLKRFQLNENLSGTGRLILHFEAVDYQTRVWLNGKFLGEHTGGYTPFRFDITDAVISGENFLALRVFDSANQKQVRGKQSSTGKGYGIWYTPASGIWQTVWLERAGESWIENYQADPDLTAGKVNFRFQISNFKSGQKISIIAFSPDGKEVKTDLREAPIDSSKKLTWKIEDPKLWSPDQPNLYQLKFLLLDEAGNTLDRVESYLGLRELKVRDGKVWLNGKPIYQKMPLVQGYYRPGNYSPESDQAFRQDLELLKEMGFNGLRMHQKIEAKRYYYWADKIGLLVWEEMPAMCAEPPDMFLPAGKNWRDQFEKEWREVIARDFNHPAIIVRVPFNESWGIWPEIYSPVSSSWAMKIIKLTRELDPTRLVVDNSGWLHRDTDLLDIHHYLPTVEKSELLYQKLEKPWGTYFPMAQSAIMAGRGVPVMSPLFRGVNYQGQPMIISEYGGFGFYQAAVIAGIPPTLLDNYRAYTLAIGKYPYLQGFCYTQEYDVEQEKNGLVDERRNPKVPLLEIRKINDQIGQ